MTLPKSARRPPSLSSPPLASPGQSLSSTVPPSHKGDSPSKGAERTKFRSDHGAVPPFHKPWSKGTESPAGGSISSIYMTHPPPSAFENRKGSLFKRSRPSQRKARNPTTFNIMVVGAQGTGKTSLLRLLLDTADISPTATPDQKANMDSFLKGATKRTEQIQTACVEICESKYDRILLSVIDTPGLDFQNGHELRLERQVTGIVKYMDTQFSDTLSEESKVVRQSKGDQHIHLCIYTIDPASIMTASARRALSALPSRTRSQATVSYRPEVLTPDDTDSDSDDEDEWTNLSMSPADIRVIRRLVKRANVLPVIARSDELTNEKLTAIKKVVRRDLDAVGLDFGVFGPVKTDDIVPKPQEQTNGKVNGDTPTPQENGQTNGNGNGHPAPKEDEEQSVDEPEERQSRRVIKLRVRLPRRESRSRTRRELVETENEPATAEILDTDSVASVRFSAQTLSKQELGDMLPFALIAPEHVRRRRALKAPLVEEPSEIGHTNNDMVAPSEDGHAMSVADSMLTTPISPSSSSRGFSYLQGPPANLRGVFVRRYRWGTIDVLSPEHCDFAALRTAVLSTHMKMLKIRTREVLYEKYRTEKLLARRATQNISEEDTRRLLEAPFPTPTCP
ncbi:hypothetical protein QCA50_015270 [Cerrena zonata]|uniref:Septin-type G domain-containing protein n=1 Tax=Cerrena zonata TaxID=2478898 RepID=A0AAW0FK99_9APHY